MVYDPRMDEFRALLQSRLMERGALARLSKESGIASHVLGRWRDGIGRPTDVNLRRLAPALQVPYEELAKMCGYLPVAFPVDRPDDAELSASKFTGALRRVPRVFWAAVVDASVALANAYADAPGAAEGPVSHSPVPPVRKPRKRTNERPEAPDIHLGNSKHRTLALLGAT